MTETTRVRDLKARLADERRETLKWKGMYFTALRDGSTISEMLSEMLSKSAKELEQMADGISTLAKQLRREEVQEEE